MPIITIFGATGSQGSSVLEAVLADGTYTPRAVSRRLDSDSSKALSSRGVEVVKADLFDKESVKAAIRGSDAVFGVTNFWDPQVFNATDMKGTAELTHGKNLVDAAKEAGVKFFIWSSLPNVSKESGGLYSHVFHYDNKAEIQEYLKASGIPYAVLLTSWFAENLSNSSALKKTDTGYTIPIPKFGRDDVQIATWVKHDFGAAALALLLNYADASKNVIGGSFPVISMKFTYPQLAAAIAKGIKKEVTFSPVETAGMAELDEMFLYQAKFDVYGDTPVPNPALVKLGVKFGTLDTFIESELKPRFA